MLGSPPPLLGGAALYCLKNGQYMAVRWKPSLIHDDSRASEVFLNKVSVNMENDAV